MIPLLAAILFTLGISALCSLLEAMVLSTTATEIESLKKTHTRRGYLLEKFREDIEETSSAILALNTIANTLGAVIVGGLATALLGQDKLLNLSIGMTLAILFFSEIIPKNIGVLYRPQIQLHFIYPLAIIRWLMLPVSSFCKHTIKIFLKRRINPEQDDDEELVLLAQKSAKEGNITKSESNMITNALSLDDIKVSEIMTPRSVVFALERSKSIESIFKEYESIPFARIPVYSKKADNIVGIVRRRDILNSQATDEKQLKIADIMDNVLFIPENVSAADALSQLLKGHQQFSVVVDEYGSIAGVLTMEDIFEHILGQEIFEEDDIAINMRALARRKRNKSSS